MDLTLYQCEYANICLSLHIEVEGIYKIKNNKSFNLILRNGYCAKVHCSNRQKQTLFIHIICMDEDYGIVKNIALQVFELDDLLTC